MLSRAVCHTSTNKHDACGNANNIGNPDPSQGGHSENVGVDGGIDDCINQIATVEIQMAALLTPDNIISIPLAVQLLGVDIPYLEVYC